MELNLYLEQGAIGMGGGVTHLKQERIKSVQMREAKKAKLQYVTKIAYKGNVGKTPGNVRSV